MTMNFPPLRLLFVSLFLIMSGGKAIYEFVPRSEPVGLFLPMVPAFLLVAAGIGILFRQEWARRITIVFCWLGLAAFCFILIAYGLRIGAGVSTPKFLVAIGACLLGGFLYWWMLGVVRSETIRSWINNKEIPNHTSEPASPSRGGSS
jgi:hypothetical protein